MLKIVICDDNSSYSEIITNKIKNAMNNIGSDFSVQSVYSLSELKEVLEKEEIQILFLDIMFGNINSAEWAIENIPSETYTQIIFMTSFPSETHLISEVEHSYFLIKTKMSDELLTNSLKKSIANLAKKEPDLIIVKSGNENISLRCSQLSVIESVNNNILIHLINGEKISAYITLKEFSKELPHCFLRCHRSFIINTKLVSNFKPNEFILENGEAVPIPPKKYKSIIKEYNSLLNTYRRIL